MTTGVWRTGSTSLATRLQQATGFFSEAERDTAAAKLGKDCEITRFKGLGEISPKEFQQFIGEEMKLSKVEYAPKPDASSILTFYMGKNTPERKDFIMGNLVVPGRREGKRPSCGNAP